MTTTKTKTTEKVSVNNTILNLFGKALAGKSDISFTKMNEVTVPLGYLVHPDACSTDVLNWIKSQKINYGSTFYKSWYDVITKNRFELYIDQILHYASTYGTDYEGEPFVPNEGAEVPAFTNFKVITTVAREEVVARCEKMLYSGIALKQETIEAVLSILFSEPDFFINIDKVRNKEAKMFLYKDLGVTPSDPTEFVRYLVYLATGKTLLIKDKETIATITTSKLNIVKYINAFDDIKLLSSVFHRFKPIFLAFKHAERHNTAYINKLRKLAEHNHVPYKFGYFEKLLSTPTYDSKILAENLKGLNNFAKVKLLQAINVRKKENLNIRAFGVRNQKLFIKHNPEVKYSLAYIHPHLDDMYATIYISLIESLKAKACRIKIPTGIDITLPTSEKSFIGNYPLGSSFDLSDSDAIVGINWRGEDGAQDLDLSLLTIDGKKYGWNSAYYNEGKSVVYSGDMTSARPEATELFYASSGFTPAMVTVNLYNGESNSGFKFFIAKEKLAEKKNGRGGWGQVTHMVDPNNIIVKVDCQMDSHQKQLGVITDNKFILAQFRTGRGAVAGYSVTDKYTDFALLTLDCYLSLKSVLTDAGFTITDEEPAIDLTDLSKDTLINLLG